MSMSNERSEPGNGEFGKGESGNEVFGNRESANREPENPGAVTRESGLLGLSLVMTCYNVADFVKENILSVFAQDYKGPMQLVIVNDASTDQTLEVIRETVREYGAGHDVCIVDLPVNRGVLGATDAGWKEVKYEWIVMVDGDDIQYPDRCTRTADIVSRHPEIGMIAMSMHDVGSEGQTLGFRSCCVKTSHEDMPEEIICTLPKERADNWLGTSETPSIHGYGCGMAFSRAMYEKWGKLQTPLDPDRRCLQDSSWEFRTALTMPVCATRGIACRYRSHDSNIFNRSHLAGYRGKLRHEMFRDRYEGFRQQTSEHLLLDLQRAMSEPGLSDWSREDMERARRFLEADIQSCKMRFGWWASSWWERVRRTWHYRSVLPKGEFGWILPRLLFPMKLYCLGWALFKVTLPGYAWYREPKKLLGSFLRYVGLLKK